MALRRGGSAPFGDVLEEHAQIDDVLVEHGEPTVGPVPLGSPPPSGSCPSEEGFDGPSAVELVETDDVRVMVSEPVAQHSDRFDPPLPVAARSVVVVG